MFLNYVIFTRNARDMRQLNCAVCILSHKPDPTSKTVKNWTSNIAHISLSRFPYHSLDERMRSRCKGGSTKCEIYFFKLSLCKLTFLLTRLGSHLEKYYHPNEVQLYLPPTDCKGLTTSFICYCWNLKYKSDLWQHDQSVAVRFSYHLGPLKGRSTVQYTSIKPFEN